MIIGDNLGDDNFALLVFLKYIFNSNNNNNLVNIFAFFPLQPIVSKSLAAFTWFFILKKLYIIDPTYIKYCWSLEYDFLWSGFISFIKDNIDIVVLLMVWIKVFFEKLVQQTSEVNEARNGERS